MYSKPKNHLTPEEAEKLLSEIVAQTEPEPRRQMPRKVREELNEKIRRALQGDFSASDIRISEKVA